MAIQWSTASRQEEVWLEKRFKNLGRHGEIDSGAKPLETKGKSPYGSRMLMAEPTPYTLKALALPH